MADVLQLYATYDRQAVHDIFDPTSKFHPQAGTWGILGIVEIPASQGDFVLFVTLGHTEGEHTFDEGISTNGVLRWQSQPRQDFGNRTISKILRHNDSQNSIYLFMRTRYRTVGEVTPYTYLGKLRYLSHDPTRENPVYVSWQLLDWPIPSDELDRMGLTLEAGPNSYLSPDSADDDAFDPHSIADAREKTLRAIKVRRGQRKFRDALLKAYGGRCAISGCAVADLLDAAHISPYRGTETNHPQNGLLLRTDLHTLFDCGLIAVDGETMQIVVSQKLMESSYRSLAGRKLRPADIPSQRPSKEALLLHRRSAEI